MARTATLAVGQYQCTVGNKDANLARIEEFTQEAARQGAQLVCFLELGTTGFAGEVLAEVQAGEGLAVATVDFDAPEGWRQAAAPYQQDRSRLGF